MLADPELHSQNVALSKWDTRLLLDEFLPDMIFDEEDIVMDIGCASGDTMKEIILPRIPKVKKIVAIDNMPEMIEFARVHNASEKIEYHVADIEDGCSLKTWEGTVSKVFSVHCFQWTKEEKKPFQCLYDLLKPKGDAVFVLMLTHTMWSCYPYLTNESKWKRFFKDIEYHVPVSHHLNYGAEYFREIFEDLGFEVLTCVEESRNYVFENDTQMKMAFRIYSCLAYAIPVDLKEEFLNDFLAVHKKMNGEIPAFIYKSLTVHLRKP